MPAIPGTKGLDQSARHDLSRFNCSARAVNCAATQAGAAADDFLQAIDADAFHSDTRVLMAISHVGRRRMVTSAVEYSKRAAVTGSSVA